MVQQVREGLALRTTHFRVRPGDRHALGRFRTDERGGFADKAAVAAELQKGVDRLAARQQLLYAQEEYALLLVFQGLDAAGKDSAIKHVMSGVDPQGTDVHAFKQPSSEDLAHDYLWRAAKVLPARGRIGLFNRSYYEEVLVVRVHPHLLAAQHLAPELKTRAIWSERYQDINAFERHLSRNGTVVRKFFLYVSRATQRKRLLDRIEDPAKNWKFSAADIKERGKWAAYHKAYGEMLAATSTTDAPWYVVPADHKWFAQALVAKIVVETLDDLDLSYPTLGRARRKELKDVRRALRRG